MVFKGKKTDQRGGSNHARGADYSTPVASRNTSPDKSKQKKDLPRKSPPKKFTAPRDKRPLKDRFGRGDTMASAQRMVDMQRQNARHLSHIEYLGAPPLRQDMIQVRLVIPGDTLVPRALSDLAVLDNVRRDNKVWITREEGSETFLDVSSTNVSSLHAALNAINQKIHHMRLSEESLTSLYFVQSPKNVQDAVVSFETGKRPVIQGSSHSAHYPAHAVKGLVVQFATALPLSLRTLVALPCLKMQINFGHLSILAKQKNPGNLLSLEEFVSALDVYSSRGRGVSIQKELSNIEIADKFLSTILQNNDIIQNKPAVALHHLVRFDVDKQTVSADIQDEDGTARVASSRCTKAEGHPPMDWIISAPDMQVDWNVRVDSRPRFIGDKSGELPEATAKFARAFIFKLGGTTGNVEPGRSSKEADESMRHFTLPRWQTPTKGILAHMPSNFQVRTCARLQYRDTPYEIETAVTQHWDRLPTSAEPDRLSWSVSVYGIHWEEALSDHKGGESSREFEESLLLRLWPGEGSLEKRLGAFLKCIFSVQTAIAELKVR
ncbi:hypothetical protein LLEC1_01091 [Akanthomyces lecanii]|uniref:Uncharacterized protein n=1 Tax=Cordyceps confragosa TaxID=2714763 RepID=A0A179I8C6_CORDF|nr:hypothetical protein LLEC1_01091 [Akanthomyces lecanii]